MEDRVVTAHITIPLLLALTFLLVWLTKKSVKKPSLLFFVILTGLGATYWLGKQVQMLTFYAGHVRPMQCGFYALAKMASDGRFDELTPRLQRLSEQYGASVHDDTIRDDLLRCLVENSATPQTPPYSFEQL